MTKTSVKFQKNRGVAHTRYLPRSLRVRKYEKATDNKIYPPELPLNKAKASYADPLQKYSYLFLTVLFPQKTSSFILTQQFHSVILCSRQVSLFAWHTPTYEHQNDMAYNCRAATQIEGNPPNFKVTELQYLTFYAKKIFNPIYVFESRMEDKIKSGNFMPLSTFITST